MSKTAFRCLLAAYVIVRIGVLFLYNKGGDNVPESVMQLLPSSQYSISYLVVAIVNGVFIPLGVIGMFCLWPLARYIWIIGLAAFYLGTLLLVPWLVLSKWAALLGEIEFLLEGVILVLIFAGPAKDLFTKRDSRNKR